MMARSRASRNCRTCGVRAGSVPGWSVIVCLCGARHACPRKWLLLSALTVPVGASDGARS